MVNAVISRMVSLSIAENGPESGRSTSIRKWAGWSSISLMMQIFVSLAVCGSVEVWLSEHTEDHIMKVKWLHEREYVKRQLHVALTLIATLCMMTASRMSAVAHKSYVPDAELPPNAREFEVPAVGFRAVVKKKSRQLIDEVSLTVLQGSISSAGSPAVIFIVYVFTIGMNTVLGQQYRLHEQLSLTAISSLVLMSTQSTTLTVVVVSVPLFLLVQGTKALGLNPDILIVPLAGAMGHLVYLYSYVLVHELAAVPFFLFLQVIFLGYYLLRSRKQPFPFLDILLSVVVATVLSFQFAVINTAVYEKYQKIELIFSLVGFLAVMHASCISSELVIDTAKCKPYEFPPPHIFGGRAEINRFLLLMISLPLFVPLLIFHSELIGVTTPNKTIILCLGFSFVWLFINLLLARWTNHVARERVGKRVTSGCPTIAFLEVIQHFVQTIIYLYVIGIIEGYFEHSPDSVYT